MAAKARHRAIFRAGTVWAGLAIAGCTSPASGPDTGGTAAPGGNAVLAPQPTLGQEIGAVIDNKVVVTFPEGGAALSANEGRTLDLASRLFRDANPSLMFVTGHADRVGDDYSNLMLSARRAQVVKRALVARGIPANRLLLQALGASDPAQASMPDGPGNRRVVITWRLL